jgi:hypothetical protein
MRFNSKCYEERQVVFDDKEKELLDKCSDLVEGLAEDFSGMSSGVTLSSHDCGDFYDYTENEWYTALLETYRLLSNLLLADSIVGRGKVRKK